MGHGDLGVLPLPPLPPYELKGISQTHGAGRMGGVVKWSEVSRDKHRLYCTALHCA